MRRKLSILLRTQIRHDDENVADDATSANNLVDDGGVVTNDDYDEEVEDRK